MDLNINEIRELMADLEKSTLRDVAIQDGEFSLHLSKNENTAAPAPVAAAPAAAAPSAAPAPVAAAPAAAAPSAAPVAPAANTAAPAAPAAKPAAAAGVEIKAPMVGTVYLQPKPDQPNFKNVGDPVKKGETVAIIEAMKLMTEIKSDVTGTIAEILVSNEEVVDFDKPLYRVTTD
ncbi:acetyl-CoA carboxylase biotin carboxyl carrier protein [Eupransor demetentiae]|uniref:Biotin carboxyl carrier protein of acetyl-CoA carboxylase n=1 Tax=Eupransor demetentiae TaxID=3109584 RepID=A0ABP0EQJ2_9LACO|nr:Biotin carboxyl carrier protein (AccB) [Lactobacillaceae bacterium LMG 33000]